MRLESAARLPWRAWRGLRGPVGDAQKHHALPSPVRHVRVVHLQFSPLFYDDELFPKKWRHPSACYNCIYPNHVNVEKVACYFECELHDVLNEDVHEETKEFVDQWNNLWFTSQCRPTLTYLRMESDISIEDMRYGPSKPRTFTLLGPDADIYEAFGSAPRTPAQACAALSLDCPGMEPDEEYIRSACEDMCAAGLMIGEAGKYLSLALPADPEPGVVEFPRARTEIEP